MAKIGEACGNPVKAARALKAGKGAPGDDLRALSVWYYKEHIMKDLEASDKSKIYEVEPKIREKGEGKTCPRDGKPGTAYVDVADDPHAGAATHMLSYTWGYVLSEIVATLDNYCTQSNQRTKDVRVWTCFTCVNQHRVKEAMAKGETISFDDFQRVFGDRVKTIGHVLPMMSPWNAPFYVTRVWCVFEIFTAISMGDACKVTVLLPPKETEAYSAAFDRGAAQEVFNALRTIQVERAEASMPDDKKQILSLIEKGPGFHKVNTAVKAYLRAWFTKCSIRTEASRLCTLGEVTTTFGDYEGAVDILERAESMLEKLDEKTTLLGATVYLNMAEAICWGDFLNAGAVKGAVSKLDTCAEILSSLDMLESRMQAVVLSRYGMYRRNIALFGEEREMREEGREACMRADDMFKKLKLEKTKECMENKFVMGLLLGDVAGETGEESDATAAMDVYEEGFQLGRELEIENSVEFVKGLHYCGIFQAYSLSAADEALTFLLPAKKGYEALGQTDTVFYGQCSLQVAMALQEGERSGEIDLQIECLEHALLGLGENAPANSAEVEKLLDELKAKRS